MNSLRFGVTDCQWKAAKNEIRSILVTCAKEPRTIAYSELVALLTTIPLEPHDPRLFHLLGEISSDEAAEGRGMLSALVVHKTGEMKPGPGFLDLAQRLGRDASDVTKCWIGEIDKIQQHYG